ncbi:MAG TPA: Fe-S protein assembly co-chaperone HscB [Polyangiaceae bacterium]|nr:Fe-S protein assembly co-chaperone HscB [Polyangiaceae bacterium]
MRNPFQILGLAPTFALDPSELERRQRDLNRALHPDRHAGRSPAERRESLSRAMDINQACRVLRDPAARAEALFELLGLREVAERTVNDPALLGEMLEQREMLDEARREKDNGRLHALKLDNEERRRRVEAALAAAFGPLVEAGPPARGAELEAARRLYGELKYVRRFGEEVAAIEDEM